MNYKRTALLLCLLAGGLYCAGTALWHLGRTAVFVHESTALAAKVVDMEKRPFESWGEALRHGNLPWDGDTAYRPFVSCPLHKEPVPIHRLKVNDLDNQDYSTGQEVEIILPLSEPEQVHLNRFKFLWGGDCLLLLAGLLLGAAGYLPLRYGKSHRKAPAKSKAKPQAKPQPKPEPKPEPAPQPRPEPPAPKPKAKPKTKASAPVEEEPFRLEATPPEPAKKKRTRKPKDPNAPAKPRKPRKKKSE